MVQVFTNRKKRPKLKGEIYFIDLQHNKNFKKGKTIYLFQGEGGWKGQIKMSTTKSCVEVILKIC
jgi:hypothetical protein